MVRKIKKICFYQHSIRFAIILNLLITHSGLGPTTALFVDYADNTELIQDVPGQNITLQCGTNGLINDGKDNGIKYLWYFMQCGENSGGVVNCYHSVNDDDWTQLPCEDNFCKPDLQLKNVTEKYSGLYKCTVVPQVGSSIVDIKLVRTYQLDIRNTSQKIPEFLDGYPLNNTITLGFQAVFQCRVYCEEYPTIKWFRRLPERNKFTEYDSLHSIVHYNGRAYELLTSAGEKPLGHDIYLSKLILNKVQPHDEGFYACVAITVHGHSIREAYLQVDTSEYDDGSPAYWSDYSEETGENNDDDATSDPSEFWLLFLMPLGLALLPLTVWLCYLAHKRCRTASSNSEELLSIDHQRMLRK
ncbi:fibroblast growth factor receptor-like 1 [Musca vetustissima]|uniref:fibroblast growth factor receptor-like 1 n=1 Tax=Musca vetustissima TaxID=27455 RepID=UPI002AB62679|nr:fibroblast growth factor receptor-like 1 [Musca vetustissima]